MTTTFYLEYYAQTDEALVFVGKYSGDTRSRHDSTIEHPMTELSPGHWTISLPTRSAGDSPVELHYHYEVRRQDGTLLHREWGGDRSLLLRETCYYDRWLDIPEQAPLYSPVFLPPFTSDLTEALTSATQEGDLQGTTLQFAIYAPSYGSDQELCLVGSLPSLGAWDPTRSLPLVRTQERLFEVSIPTHTLSQEEIEGIEYKYLLLDKKTGTYHWEEGANRSFPTFPVTPSHSARIQDAYPRITPPAVRLAGLSVPLFALRSGEDWGIGDFGTLLRDTLPFVEAHDLRVIQLLPINDTTFTRGIKDSYPYNAISVDALHPIYIDIDQLPRLADQTLEKKLRRRASQLRKKAKVDYPAVLALKEEYLRALFPELGQELNEDDAFLNFCQENQSWLRPYAWYCVLRDVHPDQSPQTWAEGERYREELHDTLRQQSDLYESYRYYCWLQYELDQQLVTVASACAERGVSLKGDLPIGVAPYSVEVWSRPELFHLDQSAGAPPDAFAADGQNWGFPTYNWERMAEDNYAWWRGRLQHQERYFSALRIDHILGFFRIWEIPRAQMSGLEGHFHPALPYTLTEWQALLGDAIDVRTLAEPEEASSPQEARAEGYPLLRDPYSEGYHPRIAWEKTDTFHSWSVDTRARWRAISDDYFYVRHNELYRQTGLRRLRALSSSTRLLLCAEDLGMIPASVPAVLDELQILSLELERMPKTFTPTGWADPLTFPQRSVATTSTHDMPSLRGWWQGLGEEEQSRYLREELHIEGPISEEEIYRLILQHHLASPAQLVILPLADWMSCDEHLWLTSAEDEQINHPEDPNQYWCFRFPCTLSDIGRLAPEWQGRLLQYIHHTNRTPFA